jgi:hypothetical protein
MNTPRILLIAAALLLAPPALAWAQTDTTPSGAAAGSKKAGSDEKAPKVKVERGRGGRKVFRITTSWVIEGRIQKPNAFYVLQRSQINYDWAKMKKNFLPRITDSVEQAPF